MDTGLTQREFALKAGFRESFISEAVNGRINLRAEEKLRIASALDRLVAELFGQ